MHHNAYMRTTLNIESSLIRRAARLTGVSKKTALVRMGLEALIARESAHRLARLGGPGRGWGGIGGGGQAGGADPPLPGRLGRTPCRWEPPGATPPGGRG